MLLAAPPCLAFEGRLVRGDGGLVADALISIVGRTGTARTGPDGRFTWSPDPALPFDLLVVLPGGRSLPPFHVTALPGSGPLVLEVPLPATEPIHVTVEAAPHIAAPPAAAAARLTHDDLEQRRPLRLADALENIPGAGRSGIGAEGVPSLRGMARGRTLLLLDGARVTTERRAGASAGFLDPFFLEAIEVTRGPGSVAYGSDALGGVIHARTRMADPGAPARLRLTAAAGTGIPERGGGIEFSRGLERGGFILQARGRGVGDYASPDGEVPNSSARDRGLLGRIQHEIGPGRLTFGWQEDAARDVERPSINLETLRVTQPGEDSRRATLSYELDPLGGGTLMGVHAFAGRHRVITRQEALTGGILEVSESDVGAFDFGLRAQAARPAGEARVEGGLDLNGRTNLEARVTDAAGGHRAIQDASRLDAALYATAEGPIAARVSGSAGARFDHVSSRARGESLGRHGVTHGAMSGFAALTAGPFRGWSVTAQAARGFRDPTLSDRYFTGPTGRGTVTGHPDLDPETSFQLDVAVRHTARSWRAAVYGYDYEVDDLIERFRPVAGVNDFAFRNAGEARVRGLEVELQADSRYLSAALGVQASRGEGARGEPLDDIPARGVTLVLRAKAGPSASLLARAAVAAQDDRPGPTERDLPSHSTLDLGAGWRPHPSVELRLLVRNVFDRSHPGSADELTELAPGRSALLTLVASVGG